MYKGCLRERAHILVQEARYKHLKTRGRRTDSEHQGSLVWSRKRDDQGLGPEGVFRNKHGWDFSGRSHIGMAWRKERGKYSRG